MLAEKLMEDDAEDIVRAVVSAAKAGDPTAMRAIHEFPDGNCLAEAFFCS